MATAVLIPMHDVEGSLLKQIGHDAETFTFAARFLPGKKSPAGKVYHYLNVSEEVYDDVNNPKNGMSVGEAFTALIKKFPDRYPYSCVDEGLGESTSEGKDKVIASAAEPIVEAQVPDDEAGLKALALSTRSSATMISISTADECELAMREVLRIRTERKLAIAKVNKIKEPATAAWKAACDLFNEVDGRYAEAERFLDQGIIAYRAAEKRRVDAENARLRREQEARDAEARRVQQEEFARQQREAQAEADRTAKELAESDAKAAEAQGAPAEVVQQIIENPLPVAVRHVAPMPIMRTAPAPLATAEVPKVQGMSFTTEWRFEITDENRIPLTHEYYTLDEKKIRSKVDRLKQHAEIPGVRVYPEEVPIKRTAGRK